VDVGFSPYTSSVRRFIRTDLIVMAVSCTALAVTYVVVLRNEWLLFLAALLVGLAAVIAFADRLLERGETLAAIGHVTVAYWVIGVVAIAVVPVILPIGPLVALVPVVLAIPFVGRQRFAVIAAGAVVLSFGLTLIGRLHHGAGLQEEAPRWVVDGAVIGFTPLVVGLLAYLAWEGHVQVAQQAAQLRRSQSRLVRATDEARHRVERDLHDGAQQQLIAITVQLRVLQELARTQPERAERLAGQLVEHMQVALTELRAIAHGIYPPELTQHGLEHALRDVARRAPRPTTVESEGLGRYPTAVEATVYFCCLEALQNVGKHAGETATVTIRLRAQPDLEFVVHDDGVGFAPSARPGRGLENINDRLTAHGGALAIATSPGAGTTVRGTIPAGAVLNGRSTG
jgi:signal transduction histidine kinase